VHTYNSVQLGAKQLFNSNFTASLKHCGKNAQSKKNVRTLACFFCVRQQAFCVSVVIQAAATIFIAMVTSDMDSYSKC
jgi:hypothetical protein